jgi:uncharacterized protein DUF5681
VDARNKAQGPKENGLRDIILAVAYRSITVSDGKKRVIMPMIEAMVRSLAANAARGQLRSQQAFTKMPAETEQLRALQNMQSLEKAIDYKFHWGESSSAESHLKQRDLSRFLIQTMCTSTYEQAKSRLRARGRRRRRPNWTAGMIGSKSLIATSNFAAAD